MSSVNDVNSIPTEGKNLIIVANVQDLLHFRAFDADGKRVVDTDESQRSDKAPQIAKLKSLLSDLWGVPELPQSDKARVIIAVISIVDHTPPVDAELAYLPNPVIESLRQRVDVQLVKIRSSRNIAGLLRQLELLLPPVAGSRPVAVVAVPRPTPYRYSVLIERTKQLVAVAQQIEASYLAALEKSDLEAEKLMREQFAVQLGDMTITLQQQKEAQADDSIELASRQQQKSEISRDRYQTWLDNGLNENENRQKEELIKARNLRAAIPGIEAALSTMQYAGWRFEAATKNYSIAAYLTLSSGKAALQTLESGSETAAQVAGIKASYDRRADEWQLQHDLAEQDVKIGEQQVKIAGDQKAIATQETVIAQKQRDQAAQMQTFLVTKFTSKELYDWMIGILGDVYAYFLQQATSMASLAETQLAFDRRSRRSTSSKGITGKRRRKPASRAHSRAARKIAVASPARRGSWRMCIGSINTHSRPTSDGSTSPRPFR